MVYISDTLLRVPNFSLWVMQNGILTSHGYPCNLQPFEDPFPLVVEHQKSGEKTTWDVWTPVNNRINYQPQLVQDFWTINSSAGSELRPKQLVTCTYENNGVFLSWCHLVGFLQRFNNMRYIRLIDSILYVLLWCGWKKWTKNIAPNGSPWWRWIPWDPNPQKKITYKDKSTL